MSAPGMTLIYEDRGLGLRGWFSTAVLIGATIWGCIEILRAQAGTADSTGYLFGAGFLAASAYGAFRLFNDSRDAIVRIEADFASGQSVVTLWRPWGLKRLVAPLNQLSNWRMYVALKTRNQQTYLLRVDHPASPRTLYIELRPDTKAVDGLRLVAREAMEEYDARTGRGRAA
jgi:hypothetical protein